MCISQWIPSQASRAHGDFAFQGYNLMFVLYEEHMKIKGTADFLWKPAVLLVCSQLWACICKLEAGKLFLCHFYYGWHGDQYSCLGHTVTNMLGMCLFMKN